MTARFRSNFSVPSGFAISFVARPAEEAPEVQNVVPMVRRARPTQQLQAPRRQRPAGSGAPAIKAAAR